VPSLTLKKLFDLKSFSLERILNFSWCRLFFCHYHPTPDTNHVDKCLTHDITFKFQTEKIWKLLFIKKSFPPSSISSVFVEHTCSDFKLKHVFLTN
jgi:hypothetical protein